MHSDIIAQDGRFDREDGRVQGRVPGGRRPRHGRLRGGHRQGRLPHVLQAIPADTKDQGTQEEKRGWFIVYRSA